MPSADKRLPGWGEMPKKPGLYLSLNHGRDFPQQLLKNEGFAGPKIGPLTYIKTRCAQQVTLGFASRRDAACYFPAAQSLTHFLEILEGMLIFGGKFYGDWDVCYIPAEFCKRPVCKTKNQTGYSP